MMRLRRLLAAAGIEPGIDAALEAREGVQALCIHERQELHEDHAADIARWIDPEVGVGEPSPGEAAGTAALRRLRGVDQEAQPPFLSLIREQFDVVSIDRGRRWYFAGHVELADMVL